MCENNGIDMCLHSDMKSGDVLHLFFRQEKYGEFSRDNIKLSIVLLYMNHFGFTVVVSDSLAFILFFIDLQNYCTDMISNQMYIT